MQTYPYIKTIFVLKMTGSWYNAQSTVYIIHNQDSSSQVLKSEFLEPNFNNRVS